MVKSTCFTFLVLACAVLFETRADGHTQSWNAGPPQQPVGGSLTASGSGTWAASAGWKIDNISSTILELSPPAGTRPYSMSGGTLVGANESGTAGTFSTSFPGLPRAGSYKITVTFIYRNIANPNQTETKTLTGTVTVTP